MADYGLLTEGFVIKPMEVIVEDLARGYQEEFGESIDVSEESPDGALIRLIGHVAAELWEVSEALDAAQDPDRATGAALAAVAALSGTIKDPGRPSTVTLTLTGDAGTDVATGSRASTASTEAMFETAVDATLADLIAWVLLTAYVVGDRRSNSGRSYVVITSGTSAGSGGPTTTAADITDGSVHWRYMGEGTAAVDVAATSVDDGPIAATSGDITQIETPVSGWSSVINLLDASPGALVETDETLRLRREEEVAAGGLGTAEAMKADLAEINGVMSVRIFVNDTDVAGTGDQAGQPPHSIEALVRGGTDEEIGAVILRHNDAGIATFGNDSVVVEDEEGVEHTIFFSRPDEVLIYIDVFVDINEETYPDDGDDQIKAAIVAWGDAREGGDNAVASAISAQSFSVRGVIDVTDVQLDDAAAPATSATVVIGAHEIAVYDTSRITVTSTPGDP